MRPAVTRYLSAWNWPSIDTRVQQLSCFASAAPVSPAPHVSPPKCPVQLGAVTHFFWYEHAADVQSASDPHALSVAHLGAFEPPQSTSDSSPFLTLSVGEGSAQMPLTHDADVQSL